MKGIGHVTIDSLVRGDRVLGALTDAAVLRDADEMEVDEENVNKDIDEE